MIQRLMKHSPDDRTQGVATHRESWSWWQHLAASWPRVLMVAAALVAAFGAGAFVRGTGGQSSATTDPAPVASAAGPSWTPDPMLATENEDTLSGDKAEVEAESVARRFMTGMAAPADSKERLDALTATTIPRVGGTLASLPAVDFEPDGRVSTIGSSAAEADVVAQDAIGEAVNIRLSAEPDGWRVAAVRIAGETIPDQQDIIW